MKRYLIPVLVLLVLASGLVIGCGQQAQPTPTPTIDTPSLRSDEVCALVYNYLDSRATPMNVRQRMWLLNDLSAAKTYFRAVYQGNRKWQVSALGRITQSNYLDFGSWSYNGGLWNLYETSGVVQPANAQATEVLNYIQFWIRQ